MRQKIIGILAGMGPRSTAPFIDMVVTQCQIQYGAKRVADFPPMLIYSLPAPLDGPLDHQLLVRLISDGLKRLEFAGVDFIAMPCNTAHIYYEELKAAISVPLLSIVDETVRAMSRSSEQVALLATRHTIEANLYQPRMKESGLVCVINEKWQRQVDRLITDIESSSDLATLVQNWNKLILQIRRSGIEAVLLACTDLNVVSQNRMQKLEIIDATAILAKAVVREYLNAT